MGLFSGIINAVKDVTGGIGDILDPVSGLVSAGSALLGGMSTNNANADIAAQNNAWSAQQYATRYQTMTKDLEAAGLNPMLAYSQSPGTAPSAQAVQFQNPAAAGADAYSKVTSSAAQGKQADTQQAVAKSTVDLNKALSAKAAADAQNSMASAAQTKTNTQLMAQDLPKAKNEAAAQSSWWNRVVAPYLPSLSSSSHSAGSLVNIFK